MTNSKVIVESKREESQRGQTRFLSVGRRRGSWRETVKGKSNRCGKTREGKSEKTKTEKFPRGMEVQPEFTLHNFWSYQSRSQSMWVVPHQYGGSQVHRIKC